MNYNIIQTLISEYLPSIGGGILGGIAVAILAMWGLGGKIIDGWVENRFKSSLQRVQNEHSMAIALLKVEIDSVLAARVKIQAKEFDIVASAWEKMSEVMVTVSSVMSPLKLASDMSNLRDDEWEEVFQKNEISRINQREILEATNFDRNRIFHLVMDGRSVFAAKSAISDLRIYLKKFGVFIPKEIGDEMETLARMVNSMMMRKSMGGPQNFERETKDYDRFEGEFEPRYDKLFEVVREQLASVGRMQK